MANGSIFAIYYVGYICPHMYIYMYVCTCTCICPAQQSIIVHVFRCVYITMCLLFQLAHHVLRIHNIYTYIHSIHHLFTMDEVSLTVLDFAVDQTHTFPIPLFFLWRHCFSMGLLVVQIYIFFSDYSHVYTYYHAEISSNTMYLLDMVFSIDYLRK